MIQISVLLAVATPAAAEPRPGVWVAYWPTIAHSSIRPETDRESGIMHGHGARPIFAIRLRAPIDREEIVAELLSPANFDSSEIDSSRVPRDDDSGESANEQAEAAYQRLREALDHHRPPAGLRVFDERSSETVWTPALRQHVDCARRLLRDAVARGLALSEDDDDREDWRSSYRSPARNAAPRIDSAAMLLRLIALDLPEVSNGEWARLEQRLAERDGEERRPDQYSWRSEQIRRAGREFALEVDLLSDRASAPARLCRTIEVRMRDRTSDLCSISGYVDSRDGWPIVLSFRRTARTNGSMHWSGTTFYRLAPLEGFVPPPNPCPVPRRR